MRDIGWSASTPTIDRANGVPIYQQIYEDLKEAILAGALPESSRLPTERALADRLGVNRSTVVHAYRELVADGLIEQRVGSGSRVARSFPDARPERGAHVPWWITLPPWQVGSFPTVLGELASPQQGDRIAFIAGVPPPEPSPLPELAASFARAAARAGDAMLAYGDSEGWAPLRDTIAERMKRRGAVVDGARRARADGIHARGLRSLLRSLAERGDEIIVEAPTYPGALQIFQIAGLRAIPVPLDEDGMRVDHVEAVLRSRRPRFIYTMPSWHNPTGVTMSQRRRERLTTVARRARVPIVEDDPYGELVTSPASPLIASSRDDVVYLSSFSKTIAPSLRLGWLVAPRTIFERLLLRKQSYDMATSSYFQVAIMDYLQTTAYDDHVVRFGGQSCRHVAALGARDDRSLLAGRRPSSPRRRWILPMGLPAAADSRASGFGCS